MVQNPSMRGRITPQTSGNIAGIAGNIGAGRLRTWQKHGEASGCARYFSCYARYFVAV
jgi:hypothetical protein